MRRILFAVLAIFHLFSCGSNQTGSKDAIRKAIIDHLSSRKGLDLDMSAMDVDITELSLRANEADATVAFRTKGSQSTAMTMQYTLERSGSSWKVKPRPASAPGTNPHGEMPQAGQPMPPGQMPPGHPPMGGGAPAPGAKK